MLRDLTPGTVWVCDRIRLYHGPNDVRFKIVPTLRLTVANIDHTSVTFKEDDGSTQSVKTEYLKAFKKSPDGTWRMLRHSAKMVETPAISKDSSDISIPESQVVAIEIIFKPVSVVKRKKP